MNSAKMRQIPWLWQTLVLIAIASIARWQSDYPIVAADVIFFIGLLTLPIIISLTSTSAERLHASTYTLFNISLLLVFFSHAQPVIVLVIVTGAILLLHFAFAGLNRSLLQPAAFAIIACIVAAQWMDLGALMTTHSNPFNLWPFLIALIIMLWDRTQHPFRNRVLLTMMLVRIAIIVALLWLQVHLVLSVCIGVAIGNLLSPLLDSLLEHHEPRKT